MRCGAIEEAQHMRLQKRLRNPAAGGGIRRNHCIRASLEQVLFSIFFRSAGNDLQLGVQTPRGQDDVHVGRIGGGSGNQSARSFNVDLAKRVFMGGIAHQG